MAPVAGPEEELAEPTDAAPEDAAPEDAAPEDAAPEDAINEEPPNDAALDGAAVEADVPLLAAVAEEEPGSDALRDIAPDVAVELDGVDALGAVEEPEESCSPEELGRGPNEELLAPAELAAETAPDVAAELLVGNSTQIPLAQVSPGLQVSLP